MNKYDKEELNLINIQIGCILRLARLKMRLSQHDLSLSIASNPTAIGRIERAENVSSWEKIFVIAKHLDIDFCNLFILKSKNDLLHIVEESYNLEEKLTKEKANYYSQLKKLISKEFNSIKK